MKLKTKILMLALVPIIALSLLITIVTSLKSKEVIQEEIGSALKANAISLRDAIEMDTVGGYTVDENGDMWKGEFRIGECQNLLENVYAKTGIVMTVCYGDTRMVTCIKNADGTYATGTKLNPEVADIVLNQGQEYLKSGVAVNGIEHYVFYLPIYDEVGGKPVGTIFAGQNQQDVEKKINSIIVLVCIASFVIMALCAGVIILVTTNIIKALRASVNVVNEVSKGNLRVQLENKYLERKDEVGEITRAVNTLLSSLTGILTSIKEQCDTLNEASLALDTTAVETNNVIDQIEKAVQEIASGATSQAEETQKASENVIVMGDMVESTTKQTASLYHTTEVMRDKSVQANQILEELLSSSKRSGEGVEEIYRQTLTTNESAKKIKEATDLITAIATETNLLSLNASIEAARAGEQGRGFTVVAGQIQKLAEQSNNSAKVIEEIITSLLEDSEKAVETMEEVKQIIQEQNQNVKQTGSIFTEVMEGIESSVEGVSVIATGTEQMDGARINVVDTVQNLTAIAEENAASTEETSAATTEVASIVSGVSDSAKQLRGIAEKLTADVEVFQL